MKAVRIGLGMSYVLAVVSGVLMAASMPGYDLWALAWFGLVPLLVSLKDKSSLHQYALINVTSIIWAVGTHWWYPAIFSSWGYAVMIAAGAFYGAFLKMGYDMSVRIRGWYSIFALPLAFSVAEWLKTVVPFTKTWWIELISKSQWTVPEQLQLLSVTGFIGLSFLIVLTNAAFAELISSGLRGRRSAFLAALLALPALNYAGGAAVMERGAAEAARTVTIGATVDLANQDEEVAALGGDSFAGDGYVADTPEMKRKLFELNAGLSRGIRAAGPVDVIVWGENEFMNLNDAALYDDLAALAAELGSAIVADTVWETDHAMYDTALLMSAEGQEIGRTPKIFTLWGEEAHGFSPGPKDFPVYETAFGPVALAVCWDRHDPSILRGYAREGARLALIPADDDFAGEGRFPYFAASDAVFRSVENRLALGSGSTSGVAQVITPYGEMTAMSGVNERVYIAGETFLTEGMSFYTKYGDLGAYVLSGWFLLMFIASERNKKRGRKEE